MLLTNVFTKSIRDRSTSMLVAAVSTAVLLFFGMAVYSDIDLSVYTDLPDAFKSLFGIADDANVGSLAFGAILATYGMLVMASVALTAGTASIAGEERNGSIGMLLANPNSRSKVLASKTGGIVVVLIGAFIILWGAALVTPEILGVSTTGLDINALTFMMFLNAAFYGFMALALSAWTGRTGLASGVTVAVMIVSFIAVGLLPLVEGWENLAKAFPWYYYQSGDPINNGIPWGDAAVLGGGIAAFAIVAFVGFNARDLRGRSVGVSLMDRLRNHPATKAFADKVAGSARVSHIWVKTASDHQVLLYIIAPMIVLLCLMLAPMYSLIGDELKTMSETFPPELLSLVGGGDLSTPEGWYQLEMYGMVVPISVMVTTIVIGTAAIAGEEKKATMGMLLANPIRRSTVVLQKVVTMVLFATIVGVVTWAATMASSVIGDLGFDVWNIAATCALATLLGLAFGGLALALGGATGKTHIAAYGAAGVGVVTFVANGFLPFSESFDWLVKWQPFYYYLSSDPMNTGMDWGHAAVLGGAFIVLVVVAGVTFQRRDLRG